MLRPDPLFEDKGIWRARRLPHLPWLLPLASTQEPEIYLTAEETEQALRAFTSAVQTKLGQCREGAAIRAGALVESLQLT